MLTSTLRRFTFSKLAITVAVLFVTYLAVGYLALPAIVKWQIERQVQELGHKVSVGDVRFDPLSFVFEADDLALSDVDDGALLGFKRLRLDFELRSVIDRAWTFAEATLEAPVLRFDLARDGRHNFAGILDRLRGDEPAKDGGALPRVFVRRMVLAGARIEYSDQMLEPPLITRIEPLHVEIDDFSTLPDRPTRYRLSAQTLTGESIDAQGELTMSPVAASGSLALQGVEVTTLVRSLSRLVAITAPAGRVNLAASYDVAIDDHGEVAGTVHDIGLDVAAFSISATGASAPLAAFETLALTQGRIDLTARQVRFEAFRLADGALSVTMDERGVDSWTRLVRTAAAVPTPGVEPTAEPPTVAPPMVAQRTQPAAASGAWQVSIGAAQIERTAVQFIDAGRSSTLSIAALALDAAPVATIGPAGVHVEVSKSRLSLAGMRVERGAESLVIPGTEFDADHLVFDAAEGRVKAELVAAHLVARDGLSARQGDAVLDVRGIDVKGGGFTLAIADSIDVGADAPQVAIARVSIKGAESAELLDLSFAGARIAVNVGDAGITASTDNAKLAAASVSASTGEQAADLREVSLAGVHFALKPGPDGFDARLQELRQHARASAVAKRYRRGRTSRGIHRERKSRVDTGRRTLDDHGQRRSCSAVEPRCAPGFRSNRHGERLARSARALERRGWRRARRNRMACPPR